MTAEIPVAPATSHRLHIGRSEENLLNGVSISIEPYELKVSPSILVTGRPYGNESRLIESMQGRQPGIRRPTAAELAHLHFNAMQEHLKRSPFKTAFFSQYAKGYFERTGTFLISKSPHPEKDFVTREERQYYKRQLKIGDKFLGETEVPQSGYVPRTEDFWDVWNPMTGLPRVTVENHKWYPWVTCFYFDQTEKEVYITRGGVCHLDEGCLDVDALYGRWGANSAGGFRQVRGSFEVRTAQKFVYGAIDEIMKTPAKSCSPEAWPL